MATQGKISDAGWIYHAPAKPKKTEMVQVPPASQIPGLSDLGPEPPMPPPMAGLIKESDSKYVQLAKMGGRQNLLRFRDPAPPSEEAKPYPRVDWYYLEDNAAEDAGTHPEVDWQFKLPEYMVHQEYKGNAGKGGKQGTKKLPYGSDKKTAFERESKPNDKTVKLPEDRKVGFGVRSGKMDARQARKEAKCAPAEMDNAEKVQAQHQRRTHEEERPNMGKLLSFGYAKDYKEQQQMEEERKRLQAYDDGTHTQEKTAQPPAPDQQNGKSKPLSAEESKSSKSENKKEKDQRFILSKFKNVPAKTNTYRT